MTQSVKREELDSDMKKRIEAIRNDPAHEERLKRKKIRLDALNKATLEALRRAGQARLSGG